MSSWHRVCGKPAWMMGVLNCTPDSFSDGGLFVDNDVEAAAEHALMMQAAGAAIIDVGGESTRPGAKPVLLDEELKRVIPVVQNLKSHGLTISIDTTKAKVMRRAIEAGASMVNDVTALTGDNESLSVVAETGVDICLMHMQGTPEMMQKRPDYHDVVGQVITYLDGRVEACLQAGVAESSIIIDPGIGFGKRLEDNLELIAGIETFKKRFALPILMGVSRKSFLGAITGADVNNREFETAAALSIAVFAGVDMVRVHDVERQRGAVDVASALRDVHLGLS